MITKLLIANRGEIACRIARTARAMGITTVAVYSEADRSAPHVSACDEAFAIGGMTAAESYLRQDAILDVAAASGAEAIHPGYGFLSENPDFADKVIEAGRIFVGPSPTAIRAMGLKDAAKKLMEEAGVPVVPGYHGAAQDPETLAREAAKIGVPLMIKAVAGGGGKGMRLVESAAAFEGALASARSEARAAFGNGDVLLERFMPLPRHIEVQIFGDGTRAVHLFERDCSLQRRHQKVIEEAPAPDMTEPMRAAMGAAAVRAAEAIGYSGAGTVEFIVDASDGLREDRFFFMEMNTRLQVEHPVTEAVTGVDLVEWQLRVARGEPLPRAQEEIALSGHAVEARLYAEDPANEFLPATGRLTRAVFPVETRVDSGVREGDEISPFYDPMIAKLITWGHDRPSAIAAMDRALSRTEIAGVTTNLGFLRRLTRTSGFQSGAVDTGLIAREGAGLSADPQPCEKTRALAALGALGFQDGLSENVGFALWQPLRHFVTLLSGGEALELSVTFENGVARVSGVEICWRDGVWWVDGHRVRASIHRDEAEVTVFFGTPYRFGLPDPLAASADEAKADLIVAPMPGLVSRLQAQPGQDVEEGDPLAVFEAMKMEHTLRAPRDGVIAEVFVEAGAQIEAGAPLIRLASVPPGEESAEAAQ
ncbi:MAG: biotin carboxylase N-terminal domain-containing protein [Pseudomonadota bacterium]